MGVFKKFYDQYKKKLSDRNHKQIGNYDICTEKQKKIGNLHTNTKRNWQFPQKNKKQIDNLHRKTKINLNG